MEREESIKRKDALVIASNRTVATIQRLDDLMLALGALEGTDVSAMKDSVLKAMALMEGVDETLSAALARVYEQLRTDEEE